MRLRPAFETLIAIVALGTIAAAQAQPAREQAAPRPIAARGPLTQEEVTTVSIFENASPSVVYITTVRHVRDFFTLNVMRVPRGTGSGFFWDDEGHIVTNYHVIRGSQEARVSLSDQRSFAARLVGVSPQHDLAVLKIDVAGTRPPPLALGTSEDLRVGQQVLAIGNPFGLDHTLTSGIISALDRSIDNGHGGVIEHLIQTDAAINPGNSGGPLIDSAGRVIGINTAIYSPSGAYAGVGFAVPVDTINRVVPRLVTYGRYVRPALGISANDRVSEALLRGLEVEGVAVLRVVPQSPADRAGFRAAQATLGGGAVLGDVIQAIDGIEVSDFDSLVRLLDEYAIGDTVVVSLWRNGDVIEVRVQLAAA